jgi:hypothetical protein
MRRGKVEEKLENLETQKWRNKGAFRLRAIRLRRDEKVTSGDWLLTGGTKKLKGLKK